MNPAAPAAAVLDGGENAGSPPVLRFRRAFKKPPVAEIAGALFYGVSYNHMVVLER